MTTATCIVARNFRGATLFLAAIGPGVAFQWTSDRSDALRLTSGMGLAAAKAHAVYVKRGESGAYVLDARGQIVAPPAAQPAEQPRPESVRLAPKVEASASRGPWVIVCTGGFVPDDGDETLATCAEDAKHYDTYADARGYATFINGAMVRPLSQFTNK